MYGINDSWNIKLEYVFTPSSDTVKFNMCDIFIIIAVVKINQKARYGGITVVKYGLWAI